MARGNIILYADLAVDFLAIVVLVYLFSQGYFENVDSRSLNKVFMGLGALGLSLVAFTIYMANKRR